MKLTGAAAVNFCAKPDSSAPGLLICGQDAMRVALKRQEAIAALGCGAYEHLIVHLPGNPMEAKADEPAFTGGPSGKPVTLIIPDDACTVTSIASRSQSGPDRPYPEPEA